MTKIPTFYFSLSVFGLFCFAPLNKMQHGIRWTQVEGSSWCFLRAYIEKEELFGLFYCCLMVCFCIFFVQEKALNAQKKCKCVTVSWGGHLAILNFSCK